MEKPQIELAAALHRTADGRITIELPAIWQCFHSALPELKGSTGSRQRLASDLRTLAESDVISLPASKSSFDRTALPPLPRFVRLVGNFPAHEVKFDHRTFPWSLPMSFVAGLARLPNPVIARRLNDFFRGDWASRPLVPVKERSYEIFGNEKILERVLEGQLGYESRMTLEKLRCYRVPLVPVHRIFAPAESNVLIVENEATFDSVSRWNADHRQFRMIIYGRGREAEKIADFLHREASTEKGRVYYFGDLDRVGISIPYRLSRTLMRLSEAGIEPAATCYRLLLSQAPSRIVASETDDEPEEPTNSEWTEALEWLPTEVRAKASAILREDQRIAQEATGWELLRDQPTLI